MQTEETSWSTPRQRKLVKWLIFCDKWPWLVDDLLAFQDSKTSDCLAVLVEKLKAKATDAKSTAETKNFDRLQEFADFSPVKGSQPSDVLTGEDIDKEFRRAADLSRLVRKSAGSSKNLPAASA